MQGELGERGVMFGVKIVVRKVKWSYLSPPLLLHAHGQAAFSLFYSSDFLAGDIPHQSFLSSFPVDSCLDGEILMLFPSRIYN